jgi:hypothetical protein
VVEVEHKKLKFKKMNEKAGEKKYIFEDTEDLTEITLDSAFLGYQCAYLQGLPVHNSQSRRNGYQLNVD